MAQRRARVAEGGGPGAEQAPTQLVAQHCTPRPHAASLRAQRPLKQRATALEENAAHCAREGPPCPAWPPFVVLLESSRGALRFSDTPTLPNGCHPENDARQPTHDARVSAGARRAARRAMASPSAGPVTTLFVHETCAAADGASSGDAPHSPQAPVPAPPRREADGDGGGAPCDAGAQSRTLYTRDTLASALCLMGAKPRHSLKVAARVFDTLGVLARRLQLPGGAGGATAAAGMRLLPHRLPRPVVRVATFVDGAAELPRPQFEALVAWALAEYQYAKPDQLEDLRLACRRGARRCVRAKRQLTCSCRRIHERRTAVFVLLCGTSGTGKSTLAALLVRSCHRCWRRTAGHSRDAQIVSQAARMGISTIISTDLVRGVVR